MTTIKRTIIAATLGTIVLAGGYLGLDRALASKPNNDCACCTCTVCTCDPCACCGCGAACACDSK